MMNKEESKEALQTDSNQAVNEKALTWEDIREKCKKRDMLWKGVWILIMVAALVYLYLVFAKNILSDGYVGRIVVSSIIIVVVFFWVYVMPYILGTERLYREYAKAFKTDVIEPVFKDAFAEATYRGFDKSQLREIKDSGLLKKARSAVATDSVRGSYDKVDFVRYDIELSTKERKSARIESVWITCDIKTKIKEEMQIICEDFKIGKNAYPQPEGFFKMQTEDEDFDNKFSVYVKGDKNKKDILDSSFRRHLTKLEKKNPFMIGFEKNQVHVVIKRKKDSLEVPLYGRVNQKKYQDEAQDEVDVVKEIIKLLKEIA